MAKSNFPPEYIREISIQVLESMISKLKDLGDDFAEIGEIIDAACLLYMLAEDEGSIAQQTIKEHLPMLITLVRGNKRGEKNVN